MCIAICAVTLVGCSNKGNRLEWSAGSIKMNGNELKVDEITPSGAFVHGPNYEISVYPCGPIIDCPHNTFGVPESDMTEFKGGSKYYSAFLGTQVMMYIPDGKDQHTEANLTLPDVGVMEIPQAVETLYNAVKDIKLAEVPKVIECDGVLSLDVSCYEYKVRPDNVVIPGLIKISANDGSMSMTGNIEIGEVSLGTTSTENYDYYIYKDLLIQAAKGMDISSIVTFRGE